MSESMRLSEQQPLAVGRIQLLIHPGYAASIHHDEMYELDCKQDHEHSPETQAQYDAYLDKYVLAAARMRADEILIVYTSRTRKEYRLDMEHDYALPKTLMKLRRTLGRRLIVLSDAEMTSMEEPEQLFEKVQAIAQARNIHFSRKTETLAYGETLEVCVSTAAHEFNRIGGFSKKTVIDPTLTDTPDATRETLGNLRERHSRIRFNKK